MNVSPLPLSVSEAQLQDTVITLARYKQWLIAHFRPAQMQSGRWATAMQGDVGFPDLVLARRGQVLFVELKRMQGRTTPAQKMWGRQLGDQYRLWLPTNWNDGTILKELS